MEQNKKHGLKSSRFPSAFEKHIASASSIHALQTSCCGGKWMHGVRWPGRRSFHSQKVCGERVFKRPRGTKRHNTVNGETRPPPRPPRETRLLTQVVRCIQVLTSSLMLVPFSFSSPASPYLFCVPYHASYFLSMLSCLPPIYRSREVFTQACTLDPFDL